MTKEERGNIQESIDAYITLVEKSKKEDAKYKGREKERPKGPRSSYRSREGFAKAMLTPVIARLLPTGNIPVINLDFGLLLGLTYAMLTPDKMGPLRIPVVDGHAEAHEEMCDKFGGFEGIPDDALDKFNSEYCLSVPSSLVKDSAIHNAMSIFNLAEFRK